MIIADDLTGALDTGLQFANAGLKTVYLPNHETLESCLTTTSADVLVVNSQSRSVSSQAAYQKVQKIAKKINGIQIYKKIDSTMRGNIGSELDALFDECELSKVILTPAFPKLGRVVKNGEILAHGESLLTSGFSEQTGIPIHNHIPTLLRSQTNRSVSEINVDLQTLNTSQVCDLIKEDSAEILVFDAVTNKDLQRLGEAIHRLGQGFIGCGSAGLAHAIAGLLTVQSDKHSFSLSTPIPLTLFVIGSRHQNTIAQIEQILKRENVVAVEVPVSGDTENTHNVTARTIELMHENINVVLRPGASQWMPSQSYEIADTLGAVALEIVKKVDPTLVLCGGDTAHSVIRALDPSSLCILEEFRPGIPISILQGGIFHGKKVFSKAGGFGEAEIFAELLDSLSGGNNG